MKKWKLQIDVAVSDNWIDDGFDLENLIEEIEEKFRDLLPYAYEDEMKVKIKIQKTN